MLIRTMMLTTALVFGGAAIAQEAAAPAEAVAPATVTDPAQFATLASSSNMFEIQSSELALERGSTDEVRAFAEQMIADHTKAGEDMTAAAEAEGVAPAAALDPKHQAMLDSLAALEGEEFDAAYTEAQIAAHDEAVALFEGYASGGPDGALRDFAAATLPTLQQHQTHIHDVAGH